MTNLVIKNMLGVAMELTDKQYKPSMESAARAVALWVASNPDYRLNRPVCYNGHLDRYTAVVELVCKEHVVILWHADGSLCVMPPGMQDTHQHRIPKSDRMNCGPRISLTFRGVVR